MKLAVLHYHLNRGGVTQVILNQLRALELVADQCGLSDVLILHGGRAEAWPDDFETQAFSLSTAAIDGLDYADGEPLHDAELADAIAGKLHEFGFRPDETILQIHNHSLGKNASLPGAVQILAQRGFRILLQVHDFAEDLRPANFRNFATAFQTTDAALVGQHVYPTAPHLHYAVLNARDRSLLLDAGAEPERVHCLPNPVAVATTAPSHDDSLQKFQQAHGLNDSQQVVLYPVRGIRRKNVGELLLWAAVAGEDRVFALTLPATSHDELPAFRRWQTLADELKLPVLFNVGQTEGLTFEENVAAASHVITTSAAEGFGLVFLEAWLFDRPLIGRDLPEITADFGERGVNLGHLSDSVQIPRDWLDAGQLQRDLLNLHSKVCAGYGQPPHANADSAIRSPLKNESIDFAALPTQQQIAVIRQLSTEPAAAQSLLARNEWIQRSLDPQTDWTDLVKANADAVRNGFSLEHSARDLLTVFRTLLQTPATGPVQSLPHPERILDAFLDISHLCPVRVEP